MDELELHRLARAGEPFQAPTETDARGALHVVGPTWVHPCGTRWVVPLRRYAAGGQLIRGPWSWTR